MNVLHVYRTYFPDTRGGIEEVIRQITCNNSASRVNRVFTLSSHIKKAECINHEGTAVYRAPQLFEIASCGFTLSGWKLFRELSAWADIIHFHFPWPFADCMYLLTTKTLQKKTVVTYHADIVRQRWLLKLYSPVMYRFLSKVDKIVSTSPDYCAASTVLQRFAKKTGIIPIGISETTYPNVESSQVKAWQERIGGAYFLFVGVLRYYKGLPILLDAAKSAAYKIVIVGSGPVEAELKAQAKDLDNVLFLGRLNDADKVALMRGCIGVVFPSYLRSEAFGVTLLEGAMYGKPLISAAVSSGMSYINLHQETGLTVPPQDASALRQAMDRLYGDPHLVQQLGQAARARYEKLFTGIQMSEQYEALYHQLLA